LEKDLEGGEALVVSVDFPNPLPFEDAERLV
jgi:hypothetical protein